MGQCALAGLPKHMHSGVYIFLFAPPPGGIGKEGERKKGRKKGREKGREKGEEGRKRVGGGVGMKKEGKRGKYAKPFRFVP